ncbi:MAG TPA: hypothetical protein VL359_08605 [bacterium]|nr:hypothetical protein [bacterium]
MDTWQATAWIGGIVGAGLIGFLAYSGLVRLRGKLSAGAQRRRARKVLKTAADLAMEQEAQEYLRKNWHDILAVPRTASVPEINQGFNAQLEALRTSPEGSTHAQRTLLKAYHLALTERRAQRQMAR